MRARYWTTCCLVLVVFTGWRLSAGAESTPSGEVIKTRIADFRRIGRSFKAIRDQLRTKELDLPVIQRSSQQIESLGATILTWFPAGTAEGQTHAKPEVWSQRAEFEAAQRKFYAEAQKMIQVAGSGEKE